MWFTFKYVMLSQFTNTMSHEKSYVSAPGSAANEVCDDFDVWVVLFKDL